MLDRKVEGMILAFSKTKMSFRKIQEILKNENIAVSIGLISNVINGVEKSRATHALGIEKPRQIHPRPKRSKTVLQKIEPLFKRQNPSTQRSIAKHLNMSLATVNRAIHQDLNYKTIKKRKVHRLNTQHKKNRKTNTRRLYETHLAGLKSEYVVTLDEALFYVDDCYGERKIGYVRKGFSVPDDWVFQNKESFKKGFMAVDCITGRGTVPLIRVPTKVKITR